MRNCLQARLADDFAEDVRQRLRLEDDRAAIGFVVLGERHVMHRRE